MIGDGNTNACIDERKREWRREAFNGAFDLSLRARHLRRGLVYPRCRFRRQLRTGGETQLMSTEEEWVRKIVIHRGIQYAFHVTEPLIEPPVDTSRLVTRVWGLPVP